MRSRKKQAFASTAFIDEFIWCKNMREFDGNSSQGACRAMRVFTLRSIITGVLARMSYASRKVHPSCSHYPGLLKKPPQENLTNAILQMIQYTELNEPARVQARNIRF